MAHFAKLDKDNVVLEVHVVHNNELLDENGNESEAKGIEFLTQWSGGYSLWKQTSYNTIGGIHTAGGTPFRKNFAGIGYTYNAVRDAFIPPQPYQSWVLDDATCQWQPPVAMPTDGNRYLWNEDNQAWEAKNGA